MSEAPVVTLTSVIVGIPSSTSLAVSLSIRALPSPHLCQAGRIATSQMVADSTPSDVALANPIIWPSRASRLCRKVMNMQKGYANVTG
jgi:hypothetical protein